MPSSWLAIAAVALVAVIMGVVLWRRSNADVDVPPGPPGPLGPDGTPFKWEPPCANLPPPKPGEPPMSD